MAKKKVYKWDVIETAMYEYLSAGRQMKRALKLSLLLKIIEQDKMLSEEAEGIASSLSIAREEILDFISAFHAGGDPEQLLKEGAGISRQIKEYVKRLDEIEEVQNGKNNN